MSHEIGLNHRFSRSQVSSLHLHAILKIKTISALVHVMVKHVIFDRFFMVKNCQDNG